MRAGRRPPEGRLPLPLFLPALAGLRQVAPGAAGKAHEAAGGHRDAQAALVVAAVKGAQGAQHVAAFTSDRLAGGAVGGPWGPDLPRGLGWRDHTLAPS